MPPLLRGAAAAMRSRHQGFTTLLTVLPDPVSAFTHYVALFETDRAIANAQGPHWVGTIIDSHELEPV